MSTDPNSQGLPDNTEGDANPPKAKRVTPPPPGGARQASADKAARQEAAPAQEEQTPAPEASEQNTAAAETPEAPETTEAPAAEQAEPAQPEAPKAAPAPKAPPAPGGARKGAPAPGGARKSAPAPGAASADDSEAAAAPATGGAPAPKPGGAPAPGGAKKGAPAPGGAKAGASAPAGAPAPGGAPKPGGARAGAPAPGGAPKPGGAPAPGGAPKPGGAPAPGGAPKPGGAPTPGGAPKPGGAKGGAPAPGGAPTPGGAPKPGGSAPKPGGAAPTPGGAAKAGTATKAGAKKAPAKKPAKKAEPKMIGERTIGQWGKLVGIGLFAALVLAAISVFFARWLIEVPAVADWVGRYPGEYHSPADPEPGFPAWARWGHFLNFFFMILIIRSGLLVRHQQKPPAYFQPRKGGKKISIYLWMHTMLDILWILNGLIFIILLFATTHWARIVPTSWEVFPNALSSMLQYATLDWPEEDGWVNYNSIQQLMYFTVVFIAAPLAIISGLRMSEWWPEKAEKLNKLYPAPLARKIHYPVMLFFVLFIIIHVFLVFSTGMRKNLNGMFMGVSDATSWGGFIWMVAAIFVTIAAVFAARPLILAPIAGKFGNISTR